MTEENYYADIDDSYIPVKVGELRDVLDHTCENCCVYDEEGHCTIDKLESFGLRARECLLRELYVRLYEQAKHELYD